MEGMMGDDNLIIGSMQRWPMQGQDELLFAWPVMANVNRPLRKADRIRRYCWPMRRWIADTRRGTSARRAASTCGPTWRTAGDQTGFGKWASST